jgi:hypothetical protein
LQSCEKSLVSMQLLKIANVFGVSADVLMRDELELEEG